MVSNISYEKEYNDSLLLAQKIREDKWINDDTIVVCCSPRHSSIMTQIVGNQLETYDHLLLQIPEEGSSQVYNHREKVYEKYDKYLLDWVNRMDRSLQYLFLSVEIDDRYLLLHNLLKYKHVYQFGCLYLLDQSKFQPSYFLEKHKKTKYQWEK